MPTARSPRNRPSAVAPSPWRSRTDRAQEREVKREAVLRAAAQVFNEQGYQASTLDQVAARLNVTKPTLYYYVKSKDEILFECVRMGLTILQEAVDEVAASGGNAADKLVAVMREYAEIATLDFGMCVIRVGEDPLPPAAKVELRRMKAGLDRVFRDLVQQGIEEGSIGPCDPRLAAFTIAGALSWIARWYRPDGGQSAQVIADAVIGLLLNGLSIRPSVPAGLARPGGCATPRRRKTDAADAEDAAAALDATAAPATTKASQAACNSRPTRTQRKRP